MQETRTPSSLQRPVAAGSDESTRLGWLLAENKREAERRRVFLTTEEEEELLLMRRPISVRKAFGLFGLLLGTLPPIAIFLKVLPGALASELFILLLMMNTICCLVGRWMGSLMGDWLAAKGASGWTWKFLTSVVAGIAWGVVTGGAGGLPAFGVGAIFGAVYAMLVAMAAFPLFTLFHGLFARGGMIDARHFWPLACGVVMVITAAILGM